MRYGELITRALGITWRQKYLWLLALLAGEGVASLGGPGGQGGGRGGEGRSRTSPPQVTPDWNQAWSWMTAHAGLLWAIGLSLVVLCVVLLLISAVANGALVKAGAEHDDGRPFGLRAAWRAGRASFWQVLAVKLFVLLAALATVIVIGGLVLVAVVSGFGGNPALAAAAGVGAGLLALAAIMFWVVFQVVVLLAVRSIVLDGTRPSQALARGFSLVRHRFGRLALLWLLILAVDFAAGLIVGIGVIVVTAILAGTVAVGYFSAGPAVAVVVGVLLGIAWLALVLTAGSSSSRSRERRSRSRRRRPER
jgi:hypothetical protein